MARVVDPQPHYPSVEKFLAEQRTVKSNRVAEIDPQLRDYAAEVIKKLSAEDWQRFCEPETHSPAHAPGPSTKVD